MRKNKDKNQPEGNSPKKPKRQSLMKLGRVKKYPAGGYTSQTRELFLQAYENYFGNVSLTCQAVGISRATFYRWMESDSRINKKFRRRIERLRPIERLLDLAEEGLVANLRAAEPSIIRFTLDRKGKHRGYGESKSPTEFELLNRAVIKIQRVVEFANQQRRAHEIDYRVLARHSAADFGLSEEDVLRELEKRIPEARKLN